MTLPTWEIVIITVIAITVFAASVYVFIRCCKSIRAWNKETSAPQRNAVTRQTNSCVNGQTNGRNRPGIDVPEIYGVPYSPPITEAPKELDPAKLENMIHGKSDLHPYYLEKRDHVIIEEEDHTDSSHRDHKVTWCDDNILIDAEFLPSKTEVHRQASFSSSLSGSGSMSSPRPKRKVHISYDRGTDGSPEIKSITTEESYEEPSSPCGEENPDTSQSKPADASHVIIDATNIARTETELNASNNQEVIVHRENWVDFNTSE